MKPKLLPVTFLASAAADSPNSTGNTLSVAASVVFYTEICIGLWALEKENVIRKILKFRYLSVYFVFGYVLSPKKKFNKAS